MDLLLIAVALLMLGGIAAFCLSGSPRGATSVGASAAVVACLLGLIPTLRILLGGTPESLCLAWDASHGPFCVAVDPLSAFFLLPVLGLSALAAVYGADYLFAYRSQKTLGGPWFFFNVFVAGMVMVVIARTALLFLVAWEVMSLAAFCLVTFEHEKAEARRAGWIYLIATHLGVAFLFAVFMLLARQANSLEFEAFLAMPALGATASGLIFVFALVGFGAKAGFVPFHVWLPEAHPAAPSHVSALMSGVMIKMGLYGLLRVLTFLGPPASWWGPTLAGIGLLTALVGISLAVYQRDLKRVLAYSSIENMGLIALSLGLGLWGLTNQLPVVASLGLIGALLHIWNHALMKGLMFLAAGSVLHGAGTKDLEHLGGLLKRMPWTGSAMVLGAVAIAALPPLNGFVGKWLMYLGLMNYGVASEGTHSLAALLSVGLLALVGGLAALTYVRLVGVVLLGSPRSEAASHAQESSLWMLGPMLVLLLLCLTVAMHPLLMVGLMSGVLDQLPRTGTVLLDLKDSTAPLDTLGDINALTMVVIGLMAGLLLIFTRRAARAEAPTWGCGYIRPTARMQYTGRSFAEMLAEHLLPAFFRPRTTRRPPRGLFPAAGEFACDCEDPLNEKFYEPLFARWGNRFARLRFLQQGKVHVYLIYIVFMVVLALSWVSLRTWWGMP